MDIFLYCIIFIIGTFFGSFFTLAVYRIPLEKDITHEHSFCPNCNHRLRALDLIPVFSYIFLGAKCRYCKQKIRPRYFILEILSGITFVLFALSMRISIYTISIDKIFYFIFGLLYFACLFIIAGIDKEKKQIQKSVLLYGYIVEIAYIIYLYILGTSINMYRYVIYLIIIALLLLLDTCVLRKKMKNSYPIEVLLLCMLMLTFTAEGVTLLTIICGLVLIELSLLVRLVQTKKNIKLAIKEKLKLPIGFYMCISNIICLIIANFYIFNV